MKTEYSAKEFKELLDSGKIKVSKKRLKMDSNELLLPYDTLPTQSTNKRVRNAKTVEYDGLKFDSVLNLEIYKFLKENGVSSELVRKHSQGRGPAGEFTAVDLITEGIVGLVINTPLGRGTRMDGWRIRTAAIQRGVPCITTIAGFKAAVAGISELQGKSFSIQSIQQWLAIVE
jgi:hypothetical protein